MSLPSCALFLCAVKETIFHIDFTFFCFVFRVLFCVGHFEVTPNGAGGLHLALCVGNTDGYWEINSVLQGYFWQCSEHAALRSNSGVLHAKHALSLASYPK